ncbi:MAG: alpha/beta hydrolase [Chloroflexi bacterium]|nr:alpha/beta hydrolase [Chloroflexota bacterium]
MTESVTAYQGRPMSLHFERDGLRLHYLDWGEGPREHLVLLHGLTSNAHAWDDFAREASPRFRVIALDLRGHGESGHAPDGYTLDLFADDVTALARHLNLRSFHLVGHSLGAMIAMYLAARYPGMIARLVLVDGGPGTLVEPVRQTALPVFTRPLGFATPEEAKAYLRTVYPDDNERRTEWRFQHGMRQNWAGMWVFRLDPELWWVIGGSEAFRQQMEGLWDMLPSLRCPVLFVHGGNSPLVSLATAQRVVAAIPDGRLSEIPGAGHAVPSDAPQAFREAVLAFLGGLGLPGGS